MKKLNVVLLTLSVYLISMQSCYITPPEPEYLINECDIISIGKLEISDCRSLIKLGDTIFLSASCKCCNSFDGTDTLSSAPSGGTLYIYRLKHAQSKNMQNTTPAIAEFTIYAVLGSVNSEPDCWMYADSGYCRKLNSMLRHFKPTKCFQDDTSKVCLAVIPFDTGTFAFSYSQGFNVSNFHRDLYAQFGDTSKFSFCSDGRSSVSWAPIDERLYFFRVEQ